MSWDVFSKGSPQEQFVRNVSTESWQNLPGFGVDKSGIPFVATPGLPKQLPITPLPTPLPIVASQPQTNGVSQMITYPTPISTTGTTTGWLEGIMGGLGGFFGGLFGGNGGTGGGMDFMSMFLLMQMMGGGGRGGGGMSNMLMMLMLMQSMPAGGLTGGTLANPIVAMMMPRMSSTKAMLLGGPEFAMTQMLFKPQRRSYRHRRTYYRRPYRRNYGYRRY